MDTVERFLECPEYEKRDAVESFVEAARGVVLTQKQQSFGFYEQTAIAAYLVNDEKLLRQCVAHLKPVEGTPRYQALQQALSSKQEAFDPVDKVVWKRQIAKLDGENRINECVELLRIHGDDVETMLELARCYEKGRKIGQAIYSLQDVLLYVPQAYFVHAELGRLYFGEKEYANSLKSYLRSVELCEGYRRGIEGAKKAATACKREDLLQWADQQLQRKDLVP